MMFAATLPPPLRANVFRAGAMKQRMGPIPKTRADEAMHAGKGCPARNNHQGDRATTPVPAVTM